MMKCDYNKLNKSNSNINGDYNDITGNNNNIKGDYNTIRGNNNFINGDYNTIIGNNNMTKGDYNGSNGVNNTSKGDYNYNNTNTSNTSICNINGSTIIGNNLNGLVINKGNNNNIYKTTNLNSPVVIGTIRNNGNICITGNRDIISSFNNVIIDNNNFVNIGEQPPLPKNNLFIENKIKLPAEEIDEIPINPEDFKVEEICSICMERKINTVIVDCGHRFFCVVCSQKYKNEFEPKCPICRKTMTHIIKIY